MVIFFQVTNFHYNLSISYQEIVIWIIDPESRTSFGSLKKLQGDLLIVIFFQVTKFHYNLFISYWEIVIWIIDPEFRISSGSLKKLQGDFIWSYSFKSENFNEIRPLVMEKSRSGS